MPVITENTLYRAASRWASAPGDGARARLTPLRHLLKGFWIQSRRRNEIYVVAILLGLYLIGALILRLVGIESPQAARFVAGLGLELGAMLSAALVIVLGARQIPGEVEMRTIYPVLAKPVTRNQLMAGKALPVWGLAVIAMGLFTFVTLAVTPRLGDQRALALAQAFLLEGVALAMLTALVFWIALWMPAGVAMLAAGALVFLGPIAINALNGLFGPQASALTHFIPEFRLLEQFGRYIDGGAPLPLAVFVGLIAYGALWTIIFGLLAARRFRRLTL
jgi:ABC-type transport system involved in multi-copper enzyme maturation permease subunit